MESPFTILPRSETLGVSPIYILAELASVVHNMGLKLKGQINLSSFNSRPRPNSLKERNSGLATSRPRPYRSMGVTHERAVLVMYRTAVAKIQKVYNAFVGVIKAHHKLIARVSVVEGYFVNTNVTLAVKQASEVCFNGIHRFLGKLRANSVYRGITGLSSPKATGGLGLGFFVPPVVLKETTSG
jgi:hypothetical protein